MGAIFGVRFRAHSTLIIFIAAMILFDWERNCPVSVRAFSMGVWVLMLVAHELGHCAMARRLGGQGDEALLWPCGGLAPAEPPLRVGPTFLTAAAGPAVNLLLCIAGGLCVYAMSPVAALHSAAPTANHVLVSLNPFNGPSPELSGKWSEPAFYGGWLFVVNYRLLLLNLLPIFPLDGGRMAQAVLWPIFGHYRSLILETTGGLAGAVIMGLVALAMREYVLAAGMLFCFFQAYQCRLLLHESGTEDWKDSFDFGSSLFPEERTRRRHLSRRVIRKARKIAQNEKAARDRVDAILAKVSLGGLNSLTWTERRLLHRTTQQQRRRETEMSRFQ
jgi:Zn-dependent protease